MRNRFNQLSPIQQYLLVVCLLAAIGVAFSLIFFPDGWISTPWSILLLVVGSFGVAIPLIDSVAGGVGLFQKETPDPHDEQMLEELQAINTKLPTQITDDEQFNAALQRYLTWVENHYSRLNLRGVAPRNPDLDKVTLKDVYVSLRVTFDGKERDEWVGRDQDIDMAELLKEQTQLAIIGGPGSGKTTFLHIIASAIAHAWNTQDRSLVERHLGLRGELPVPIVVPLSEYNRHRRKQTGDSRLRTYINRHLIANEVDLPNDFFERLLDHPKRCLLLLDGLDEVANEDERSLVRGTVERLADTDEIEQIIVTSRTHAYEGESRLGAFRVAAMQPMQPAQVSKLIARWCTAVYSEWECDSAIGELQAAIDHLEQRRQQRNEPRLIDTPLMVTIVAIVHYDQHRLPEQRSELYEKCIDVFLREKTQRTDQTRLDLQALGGTPDHKRQLLALLAFRMMCAGRSRQDEAGRVVSDRQIKEWLQARMTLLKVDADAFIAALRERGSLLSEQGGLYRFVHLTFQEYLAAYYLYNDTADAERILIELTRTDRAAQSWWRETVLLLINYMGNRVPERALAVVRGLASAGSSIEAQMAMTAVAAHAFSELDLQHETTHALVQRRLAALIASKAEIAPLVRLDAGDALALPQIGDPRPGVGVLENGLPDIAWGGVVPAGMYTIGGDRKAYRSFEQKEVEIVQAFRLAKYPVTVAQFDCFVQADDADDERWWAGMPVDEKYVTRIAASNWAEANRPRETITWYQAVAFCRWLNDKLTVEISLPHEHEWEVAARYAGDGVCDRRGYVWGDDSITHNHANYSETNLDQTWAVGLFIRGKQSKLGLHDLSGNVWEWCANKYEDVAMANVDESGDNRTLRGGSLYDLRDHCRAAYRHSGRPHDRDLSIGMRLCVRVRPSH